MDLPKALICQCCGGHIDRRTMKCPYCETQYNGKLEPVTHIVGRSEPYGVQTHHAEVYVDELAFQNQEIAMKIAREKLYEAMMKSISPYVEIEECRDYRRFGRTLRGRLKIFSDKGRNSYG